MKKEITLNGKKIRKFFLKKNMNVGGIFLFLTSKPQGLFTKHKLTKEFRNKITKNIK